MDAAACEVCRGHTDKQMLGCKILHAEKWNKVSKTSKEAKKRHLGNLRHLKAIVHIGGRGWGKHTNSYTHTTGKMLS